MSRQYLKAAVTSDAAADIQAKSHKQKPYRPVDEEDYTVKSVEAKLYNFNDLSPGSDSQKMSNDLPAEIIAQISSYVAQFPSSQNSLCACSYVSRSWYAASVAFLYETPQISGKNFDQFVRTVCPSINAHVRVNGLAELVRRLDMSNLVHNGSKSLTARLLGRVKGNLVVFVAPQASFAVNCLAALSRCTKLIHLDLSLVSESLAMTDLFHSISNLHRLESFLFPRSSSNGHSTSALFNSWPQKLRRLELAGGVRNESILYFATVPNTLTHLVIGDCPQISMAFIRPLTNYLGSHLEYLRVDENLPKLSFHSLSTILDVLPTLRHLTIAVEYISETFFMPGTVYTASNPHRLRSLKLSCLKLASSPASWDITADTVWMAVVEGPFKNLRKLRVCQKLGWSRDEESHRGMRELGVMLEALAREDCEGAPDRELDAGLWVFDR